MRGTDVWQRLRDNRGNVEVAKCELMAELINQVERLGDILSDVSVHLEDIYTEMRNK